MFDVLPTLLTGEGVDFIHGELGERFDVRSNESGLSVSDDFSDGATGAGEDGGATGHRFDHDQAEGFGPVDREDERSSIAQELAFFVL